MIAELRDMVEFVANLAQAFAVIFAAIALVQGQKDAQATRDLEIFLNLSQSFRRRWEAGWGRTLQEIRASMHTSHVFEVPEQYREELSYMLNWVDWLGTIMRTSVLGNDDVIFGSIGPTIMRIINAGRPLIERQCREHGLDYWGSLFIVARRLNIEWVDDLERELSESQ